MWHFIKSYINFLKKSTNHHGVHSPFVFNLITECFYNTTKNKNIKAYRSYLLKSKNTITVNDFGAGSRVFTSNRRKVSAIARNAGIPLKKAYLLNRLTAYLQIKKALELGTSLGIGTAAIAFDNQVAITTIEGCPQTIDIAQKTSRHFGLHTISHINDTFEKVIPSVSSSVFDLIYIDGNHQKKATLSYFESLLNSKHNDSLFIFDDIHWSSEMEEAWEIIKKHPEVTVTIDTFYWGFVFFRKEQAKEDFIIRL